MRNKAATGLAESNSRCLLSPSGSHPTPANLKFFLFKMCTVYCLMHACSTCMPLSLEPERHRIPCSGVTDGRKPTHWGLGTKPGSHCIALTGLQLTVETRLTSNSPCLSP